jgi:hypothetical protein
MLKIGESFPKQALTADLILKPHNLIIYDISVIQFDDKKRGDYFSSKIVGRKKMHGNISIIVEWVKTQIDKMNGGDEDNTETDPTPVNTPSKNPVFV